ncbi:MAG: AMP-binding protein [Phenylobacterium sp.]|uniref:AMP-binding protein n=1 Tax=Phenylobacterium sp. TaxID=1871053 RepID=UPI002732C92D|nr:AMP-binding protein [Phenylobacterium sp.]MDP3748639.1 AMP-binding protein [Phenylobacterium sp.]
MDSLVCGRRDIPLMDMTIGEALDAAAARWPSGEAVVFPEQGVRLSWSDLKDRAEAFAAGLLLRGLRPGDRLGVWSLNRVEWVIAMFAAAKAGLVLVNVNPAYRLDELEYALAKVDCKALVISPPFKTSDYPQILRQLVPEIGQGPAWRSVRLPALRLVVQMGPQTLAGAVDFAGIEKEGRAAGTLALLDAALGVRSRDPANIQFTSGTTGRPKGVTLSHHSVLNNGYFCGLALGLTAADRIAVPVPLYHCFGMVMAVLAGLTHGAATVFPGEGFDPGRTLATVAAERCTALYGVPTMFISMLDDAHFDDFDLSSLRTGIMAGSPCPIKTMREVVERMNMADVTIAYGMTETSPVSFQSGLDDTLERRVSTIGQVHPHVECKVIDAEGRTVPRGAPGELCTRGYSVMLGYWEDPEQTAAAIDADGWMHSGDLAVIDEAGYGTVVGRLKDLIIRGGENLYPREIEEFLSRHPKIRDVQVFGVPDDRYGEEVCAWIVVADGESMAAAEIDAYCEGSIAHQKKPRYVRFVETFPLTVTGKPQKFLMRDAMVAELAKARGVSGVSTTTGETHSVDGLPGTPMVGKG